MEFADMPSVRRVVKQPDWMGYPTVSVRGGDRSGQ
jgi:hypothetical protein